MSTVKDEAIKLRQNIDAVYAAGKAAGGDTEAAYNEGVKAEYDRFWDEFQWNGNRRNYRYAFAGSGFNVETLNPKYVPIVPTGDYAMYMFHCNMYNYPAISDYTEICKKIDFSQITNATSLFQNCTGKNITVDLSNCTDGSNAFNCNSGGSVDNVTLKVTEKLTSASMFFYYNADLTTLTFTDDSVIAFGIYLARSPKLTVESAKSVIKALKDFTGTGKEFTLTASFTAETKALLEAEGATAPNGLTWLDYATAKGWNI